ncbi:MAG: B12-binding domain-containing protein [Promethearchaeota archaeon]
MVLKDEILEDLQKIVIEGDYEIVHDACQKALDAGFSASEILNSGLIKGLRIVGKKYEDKEFFLPDLILSGETMKEGLKFLEPLIEIDESSYAPKIILGTVKDDIHNLGKLILSIVFKAAGFSVIDLGVDVPTATFIQRAKETNAEVIGVSCFMASTLKYLNEISQSLAESGIRDNVIFLIGGPPVSNKIVETVGADGYAKDAFEAVKIIEQLLKSKQAS